MTAGSQEEASRMARTLVEEKLAACVNIIPGMKSIYRWKGKLEEGAETVVIAKTRESLAAQLTERVKSLHSYECPCVVSIPIQSGNGAFLDWIGSETG
ncbi:divalent-cation tolerance protein CutA [Fibrobacterota bacterium]